MTSNHHAPYGLGYTRTDSYQTAGEKPEEGGDDVKSSCPLWPGLHTYYNGVYSRRRVSDGKRNGKRRLSSD